MCNLTNVREEMRAGNEFPDADEFPALMWDGRNGPLNEESVFDGFLTDPGLIKVRRCLSLYILTHTL